MDHRNLVLAYAVTWTLQLGYATWVAFQWMKLRKAEKAVIRKEPAR
ncbi:MAG: hypothetical protein ACYC46_13075 [Acidobacteriaceae bacterium]